MSMTLEDSIDQMIGRNMTYAQCKLEIEEYWQEPGRTKGLSILERKSNNGLFNKNIPPINRNLSNPKLTIN